MSNPAIVVYNPRTQKWEPFQLVQQQFSIGRAPGNDLVLDDPQVSQRHAMLQQDERGVWVIDLNTTNGVSVNNARIQPGQWFLLPGGATITIGDTILRLQAPDQPARVSQPAQPVQYAQHSPAPASTVQTAGRKKSPVWLAIPAFLLCICLAAGAVAAWKLVPQLAERITGTPGAPVTTTGDEDILEPPRPRETLQVVASSEPVKDMYGVALEIPASVLPDGEPATLESANLSSAMQKVLEKAYEVESLAYSVTASGQDGTGRAVLTLPAPSPDSRLAVLVDNKFLGILDIEPQNGVLHVNPFLGSPLSESSAPNDVAFTAANRYFVVTPKTAGSDGPVEQLSYGSRALAGFPLRQEDPGGKSCITEFWLQSHCWRNLDSTVYVFWESNVPSELKDTEYLRIEDMIQAVAEIMRKYNQDLRFNSAAISKSNPVYIIIDPAETEPTYSQKTGNVYLNWNVVGTITSPENHCALAHELMHWTEDEEYAMNAAALSNPRAWWLEMAAENGAFMIDPACIDRNLEQYGRAVTNDNLLPLQSASLVWNRKEGARYIQALQVYISMCAGGANCALSQDQFVAAINNATYPFDDSSTLAAYQRAAKDMGLFLLGNPPTDARSDAHIIPSTKEGGAFAEYIWLKAVPDPGIEVSDNGKQILSTSSVDATVKASIAQGGEYPLWISNGKGQPGNPREGYTSLPAMLKIDPGTKLWYTLDGTEPVFHDGSQELTLGPLSDKLGTGLVRLVAIAPDGPATFSAKTEPLDLSGDWSASLSNAVVTPIDCQSSSGDSEDGLDTENLGKLDMLTLFSMYGTYVPDANMTDGSHLIWQGTFPENTTGESDITIKPDKVEVNYRIVVPEPADEGLLPPWLGPRTGRFLVPPSRQDSWPGLLVVCVLVLAAALHHTGSRIEIIQSTRLGFLPRTARAGSRAMLASGVLAGVFWLSGCLGFGVWGTIEGTATFTKLEYIDPKAPAAPIVPDGQPVEGLTWKLHEGSVETVLDLYIEVTAGDMEGNTSSEVGRCNVSIAASAEGIVGPEDMVKQSEE